MSIEDNKNIFTLSRYRTEIFFRKLINLVTICIKIIAEKNNDLSKRKCEMGGRITDYEGKTKKNTFFFFY